MIKSYLKWVLLVFTAFLTEVSSQAQIRSFSPEPAGFIVEFETFIKSANQKGLNDNLAVFKENWNLGKYSPTQQQSIIRICNNMLNEGMPVQPHFELMLQSLSAILENRLPEKTLLQWQQVTKSLLGTENKDYLEFLKLTSHLFQNKSLFEESSSAWYTDSTNYDIIFDKTAGEIALQFAGTNLVCKAPSDKMVIHSTKGVYYPAQKIFKGKGGFSTFDRVMPGEGVKVEWKDYTINLGESNYKIDTAELSYTKYFGTKVKGRFQDKLNFSPDSTAVKKSGYPKFSSFANSLEIKGIVGPNAALKGGFTMNGAEINTQTANGEETELYIYYKDKKRVKLTSKTIKIENGIAASPQATFTVSVDSGQISHPAVAVSFLFGENKLIVNRGTTGLMRAPFYDDYHKVDLDVEQIRWKLSEPFMDFDNTNNDLEVKISSADFFKEVIYARVQGALSFNPLESINAYYNRQPEDPVAIKMEKELKDLIGRKKPEDKALIDSKLKALQARKNEMREFYKANRRIKFDLNDYAAYCKTQAEYLRKPFIDLHDAGYITYFADQDSVLIKPKLFKWVQSHDKNRDYDVIRLSSLIAKRSNITLNLLSNELNVEGVQKFYFSDSQNVVVVPTEQQVSLLKDRRIRFGGMIRAGRFDFFGQKFEFDYSNFQIMYSNIDSMRLYFPDSTGRSVVPIKSVLRNIYGTLYIDKPNNKSGLQNFPEYPIFKSSKGSEVLYDKPYIHGGAYKADKFKFVVDPFIIDSLDNFTIAGLQFEGTFQSDGIFPEFRHFVSIQKDYSLGFIKPTPPGGYPMYKGKGQGEMVMSLSEQGFYGLKGNIGFNGSNSKFEKILLLPKKAVGTVESYELPKTANYPKVYAANAGMEWNPYEDKFNIAQGETPIKVFESNYDFNGSITQTPAKVFGNGTLNWDEARYSSRNMLFGPNKATADTGNLQIFAADPSKIAFETSNVRGGVDFDKRMGNFTTNVAGAQTKFPFNSFSTNLNDYQWDMNAKTIAAKMGASMAGSIPYWKSLNPTQDSLVFEGKAGVYSLKDYTLKVEQIPYIDIADSRVFLKNGKVTIRENASIDQLDSARIVANRENKFHNIYRSDLKIYGRLKLRGKGLYVYVNKLNEKQEFLLDSVVVNPEKLVEGWGRIDESLKFTLDTKIGYKGFAQILSNEQHLRFRGYVKPLHTFKNVLPSAWIRFDDRIDPKHVVINMQDPRDKDNKKQFVGLFVANDSSHVYPLFYSWKRRYSDPDVTNDTGILYYDHGTQSFFAGNKAKLLDGALKGSYIQLNEKDHSIHAEGPLDFGLESNNIKFKNAGTADLASGDSSFTFNLAMMLDFPLHKDFTARLKEMLLAGTGASMNINTPFFKYALGEMISEDKTARQIIKNIEKTGKLEGRDEAEYKLILSDATFRWDSKMRGMYCNDNVTLASFAGTSVNKDIKVTMLLEHKRAGENMYIYLDLGNSQWVYINLTKTIANVLSSDQKLNEIAAATAEKLPADDYFLKMATQRQVDKFLLRFAD